MRPGTREYGRKGGKLVLADSGEVGHDRPMSSRPRNRTVAIVVYPGIQSLDVTGPLEVFAGAARLVEEAGRPEPGYHLRILSPGGLPVTSASGLRITPDGPVGERIGALDTLIVAGGPGHAEAQHDRELIDWITAASARARRTASVCTGAFLLAQAGLLSGRRATTHWAFAQELALSHPDVRVDPEPIFVRDGSVWTSAGVTCGMDLALALVEDDLDRDAALLIARMLVLFLRRPGNQSQFSAALRSRTPRREPLREVQRAVIESVAGDHTVEALAERAHLSPRHFARAFRAETGMTPARYVEQVRVEAARRMLEESAEPIATVASACGFGTPETMRRAFVRALEVGPAEYRRRFRSPPPAAVA